MTRAVVEIDLAESPEPELRASSGRTVFRFRYGRRRVAQLTLGGEPSGASALASMPCWPVWDAWLSAATGVASDPPPAPPATIAICCRDRPADLEVALSSLAALPDDGQEILVVDSASATAAIAELVTRRPGVRYLRVERAGLDRARNAALRAASHDLVAFVDDDAEVEPEWLRALLAPFADERVVATTGLVLPRSLAQPGEDCFERHFGFGRGYERRRFTAEVLSPDQVWRCGVGASFAVHRRRLEERVGFFDEALDVGTPVRAGGDNDLLARVLASGSEIEYRPDAVAWHRHPTSIAALAPKFFGYGVSWTAFLALAAGTRPGFSAVRVVVASFRRQLARLRRALAGSAGAVPARLLLAEALGWCAGVPALLYSRWREGPRPRSPRAAAAVAPAAEGVPASRELAAPAIELDLEPGLEAAAAELAARRAELAVLRLGDELVGVLAHPRAGGQLDGAVLRAALAGELALGFLHAIARRGVAPRGLPPLPFGAGALAHWFGELFRPATAGVDAVYAEGPLADEERYRYGRVWLARLEADLARLATLGRDQERRLDEQAREHERQQASLAENEKRTAAAQASLAALVEPAPPLVERSAGGAA